MDTRWRARCSPYALLLLWLGVLCGATFLASAVYHNQHPPTPAPASGAAGAASQAPSPPLPVGEVPEFPLKIVTVLSGPYRMACSMLESAVHNGIDIHVVGWGSSELNVKDFKKKEDKLKKKIPFLYNYIKGWSDDTVIMFIDGGDVLWQRGPEPIYLAYKQMATKKKVVFSAERNCWIRSLPQETCKDWPARKETPYRYLNSGCWLGELGEVRKLLEYVNQSVEHLDQKTCPKCGDQALFGKAFIADGWNHTMQLDHSTRICQNLHMSQDDFEETPTKDRRVRNAITKNIPALFHFNGNPRHPRLSPKLWLERMWWHGRPVPASATVNVEGQRVPLREMCPKLSYADDGAAGAAGQAAGGAGGGDASRTGGYETPQRRIVLALAAHPRGTEIMFALYALVFLCIAAAKVCYKRRKKRVN